jgi:hypothetical protein
MRLMHARQCWGDRVACSMPAYPGAAAQAQPAQGRSRPQGSRAAGVLSSLSCMTRGVGGPGSARLTRQRGPKPTLRSPTAKSPHVVVIRFSELVASVLNLDNLLKYAEKHDTGKAGSRRVHGQKNAVTVHISVALCATECDGFSDCTARVCSCRPSPWPIRAVAVLLKTCHRFYLIEISDELRLSVTADANCICTVTAIGLPLCTHSLAMGSVAERRAAWGDHKPMASPTGVERGTHPMYPKAGET